MKPISVFAAAAAVFLGGLGLATDANAAEKKAAGKVEVGQSNTQLIKKCLPGFYVLNGSCVSNSTVPLEAKIKKRSGKSASGATNSGS